MTTKWTPPGPLERTAALGFDSNDDVMNDLPLCAACCSCNGNCYQAQQQQTRHGCFVPKSPPVPGDWLAKGQPGEDERAGQCFTDYVRGKRRERRRKFPSQTKQTIYLVNIDATDKLHNENGVDSASAMEFLRSFVETFFGLPCRVLEPLSPSERNKLVSRHEPLPQYLTGPIHSCLRKRKAKKNDAFAVVGITMVDLYPCKDWNFVFGEADVHNSVGVFSFARYEQGFTERWEACFSGESASTPQTQPPTTSWPSLGPCISEDEVSERVLFWRRCLKILAHEIGHLFHMEHCVHYQCLMNGAKNLAEEDRSPLHLCPICLRKLHYALSKTKINFDVLKRYQSLVDLFSSSPVMLQKELYWVQGAVHRCNTALAIAQQPSKDCRREDKMKQVASVCCAGLSPSSSESGANEAEEEGHRFSASNRYSLLCDSDDDE